MLKHGLSVRFAGYRKGGADPCGFGHRTIEVKNKRAFVVCSDLYSRRAPMNVMKGSLDASLLEVESFVYQPKTRQEESEMPTYILLSTLTPEGRRTLHSDPDR